MIGKGKAIAHGGNAIDYAMREDKIDAVVGRNMIDSGDPADILREFEAVNQHNYRCKNKYLRFEIGIAPQDRDKLKPEDMGKIARTFARKMGLQDHQWIACTHKDTGKPHIHLIANRIGVDGGVFETTFISNRSAHIAEEISREMGLTIANDVRRQNQHQETYTDPARQQAKEKLQKIAYLELRNHSTLEGFLYALDRKGIGIEPAKNKQGKTYGIRFSYEGHTFKASEIGREFGYHSLAKNFSCYALRAFPPRGSAESNEFALHSLRSVGSPEQDLSQRDQQTHSHGTDGYKHPHFAGNSVIGSLLGDLLTPVGHHPAEDDNDTIRKKKKHKRYYGRQQ